MRKISCEQGGRAATHESAMWMWRLLLMIASLALLWLFAFVAESRADGLATAPEEMSEVFDPDSSTAAEQTQSGELTTPAAETTETPPAEGTPPPVEGTPPPVEGTPPPVEETPPPVEETPPTPPVAETPPTPPVAETPPSTPPVAETPPTPPVAETPPVEETPPVAIPPTETTPTPPAPTPPTVHSGAEGSVNPVPLIASSGTSGDEWITPDPALDFLSSVGAGATTAGAGGTSGSDVAPDQSDAQESSVPPSPSQPSPWAPRHDKPLGGFGGGGISGGSTGGGSGGPPMVLATLIGLLAFAQLFGSRLSTSTTPLHGAAPAFQLKRPG